MQHNYNVITFGVIIYVQKNHQIKYQSFFQLTKPKMQLQSSQLKQFNSTQEVQKDKHINKKYVKITEQVKTNFLKFIIESNMSIKKASQALRINYSSAKAILSLHKKTIRKNRINLHQSQSNTLRSSYKLLNSQTRPIGSKFTINCSVGGKIIDNNIGSNEKHSLIFRPEILVSVPHQRNGAILSKVRAQFHLQWHYYKECQ